MQREVVISANFIFFLLFHGSSSADSKIKSRKPCKRLLFYFHGIIYNGQNAKNATSAIAASPQWGNKTILAGQNHFGDVVVFDDPITLDNNLHSPQVIGRAQGMYLYDRKDYFTAWLGFSFWFNSTNYMGTMNFIGADPLNKTRDISVVGGTGDFFMARGIATIMTDAFENEVYFRLRLDIKLYECW